MKRLIYFLRWMDNEYLPPLIYPVYFFGYEEISSRDLGNGFVQHVFRWKLSEQEREPYFRHNREIQRVRCLVRKLAVYLGRAR